MLSRQRRLLRQSVKSAAELLAPGLLFRYRLAKYSSYEPEQALVRYFCDKKHIAIDVGSNIGLYSGLMVRYARACQAFEANPRLARQLRRAAVRGLTVTNAAVSDHAGELTLHIPRNVPGLATVEQAHPDVLDGDESGRVMAVKIRSLRLDDLEFEPISLIKIDVEGHEESVLRGSSATLDRHRPYMIIESENRHNPGAVSRVCGSLLNRDYQCFILKDGRLKPFSQFDESRDQDPRALELPGKAVYINNFVFLPAERVREIADRSPLLSL